jgi:tryptophan-rich hypothetical protein
MNTINPRKLLNSKWTALQPVNRERHFMVSSVLFDEQGAVVECEIEAVLTRRVAAIDWRTLKDSEQWAQGWK